MATLRLSVYTAKTAQTLARDYERPLSAKYPDVQACADLLQSILAGDQAGGPPSVSVNVKENAVRASGTFTFASIANTNTLAINGVTFTCVTSGATGNQFNVGASDTEAAANAVIAINASVTALVAGYVTASSALGVVTITSSDYGIYGNQVTITGGTHVTASGARLTSGAVDSGAVVYTF